ncbi:MAG: putative fructokinase [Armatimonadetes bacterium]|jgi:fructokinase|nr:putative fructokinase [Armatimonadota bacterium]
MATVLCLGEALIDFVADVAGVSLAECPGFRKAPGGAPANVAVGLARLGVSSAFLGKVGDDAFGHFLEQTFAAAGADTRYMRFDPEARTGLAFVSLKADGDREFLFFRNPSADMRYRPEEIPDEAFEGCRALHFGSITLIQDPSRAATLDAIRRARERGALISFDPNLRPALWPDLDMARREILAALPLADVVKVSDEEAEFLFGPGSPAEHARRLLEAGAHTAAITSGAGGSHLATTAGAVDVPGFSVQAVDTTGAGDGFVAGLLAGLLAGPPPADARELEQLARFANAVGALACLQKGAIPALPTRAAVEQFLAAH